MQALIQFHRNDLEAAATTAGGAAADLAGTGPRYRTHWTTWVRALLLEADGQTGQALTRYRLPGITAPATGWRWNTR